MDIAFDEPYHITTIRIPKSAAAWVKERGMTLQGAFIMGIRAMQERSSWNDEIKRVEDNMNAYRARMVRAEQRLRELGEKVEA